MEKEKEITGQKYNGSLLHRAAITRMWAYAQSDGRPAEYRWRPLRKFRNSITCTTPQSLAGLTPAVGVPCSNAANIEEERMT